MARFYGLAAAAALIATTMCGTAGAARFSEPSVFSSKDGVLDILMIARPKPVTAIRFRPPGSKRVIHPEGWVYEICYRSRSFHDRCISPKFTSSEFGGVRLALQPGDKLKVRLVNKLPKQDFNKVWHYWNPYASPPEVDMHAGMNLPLTPTNLHTHGLVVQARAAGSLRMPLMQGRRGAGGGWMRARACTALRRGGQRAAGRPPGGRPRPRAGWRPGHGRHGVARGLAWTR